MISGHGRHPSDRRRRSRDHHRPPSAPRRRMGSAHGAEWPRGARRLRRVLAGRRAARHEPPRRHRPRASARPQDVLRGRGGDHDVGRGNVRPRRRVDAPRRGDVPAETVRLRLAAAHARQREADDRHAPRAPGAPPRRRARRRPPPRHLPRRAAPQRVARPGRARAVAGADRRRVRHRQGRLRAPDPQPLAARPRTVRRPELRRPVERAARIGALRPRARRVHERGEYEAGPLRSRGGRHAVPRRDRRDGRDGAGAPAEGDRGEALPPRRRDPRSDGEFPSRRGDEPRPRDRGGRRTFPERLVLSPQRRARAHAAAARAPRGHPGTRRRHAAAAGEGDRQAAADRESARAQEARAVRLARQRARAAQRARARAADDERQGDPQRVAAARGDDPRGDGVVGRAAKRRVGDPPARRRRRRLRDRVGRCRRRKRAQGRAATEDQPVDAVRAVERKDAVESRSLMPQKFYITTAIDYVNDDPHIGHMYEKIVADVIARHRRRMGDDVWFLTGTDEHGQKIERSAAKEGIQPIALSDRVVENHHELWKKLNIANDDFIRTTEARHRVGVLELIRRIQERMPDDIYLGEHSGWYCQSEETFIPENQVKEGKDTDGHAVEWTTEKNLFFKLSRYTQPLLEHYRANPSFVYPATRLNEVMAFVEQGLKDLSISRTSIKWGVPFPGHPDHVIYVWMDALTNYISALGFGSGDHEKLDRYWPADIHLVGKDIVRFHAVYWPAFLMSAGLPLPKQVVGHGWWLRDNQKISKSVGNVVRPMNIIDDFGADPLRYYLLREMVFGQDQNYSDESFLARYNADLANDLGNTLSRAIKMSAQYFNGKTPPTPCEDNDLVRMRSEEHTSELQSHSF